MPAPETRLIKALRRKFRTAQDAMKALGLDAKLLTRDQEPDEDDQLREFVRNLSPEQMGTLFQMLEEEMRGMPAPDDNDQEAIDDPPPFPGMPKTGGKMVGQDASFGTARIGQALGTVTMKERAIITKRETRAALKRSRPRLAQDRAAARKAPSGYEMFANAARIKQAM